MELSAEELEALRMRDDEEARAILAEYIRGEA